MKVLLGMSGGLDSTVSALLLKEQGYDVVGVTFRTYDSMKESCLSKEKGCCTIDSIMEARDNAHRMGFEHHIVDFRDTFREHVVKNFVDEYMHGRTPNPCVLCNSYIKWGEMLRVADEMGCDYVASGHYARIGEHDGHAYLRTAADEKKDQTYFMWMVTEENLRRVLFPLGDYTKPQVREIAREHGYVRLAQKPESQEICFIPNNDYRSFLRTEVSDYDARVLPGAFVDKEGHVLGRHAGFPNYTIGQRKGLGIALGKPAYVTHIDAEKNEVTLGENEDLLATSLTISDLRLRDEAWLRNDPHVLVRIRYKSRPVPAVLEGNTLHFAEPVWGVTPGQSAVLYKDDLVVGGGFIA